MVRQSTTERTQHLHLLVKLGQLCLQQIANLAALFCPAPDCQKTFDFVEGKPQCLRLLNELDTLDIDVIVQTITGSGPSGAWQELNFFIISDCISAHAGDRCKLANASSIH